MTPLLALVACVAHRSPTETGAIEDIDDPETLRSLWREKVRVLFECDGERILPLQPAQRTPPCFDAATGQQFDITFFADGHEVVTLDANERSAGVRLHVLGIVDVP